MALWIFQGMLNFPSYEDITNLGKQFSEILKFTKPWQIFPETVQNIKLEEYEIFLQVSENQEKV